MKLSGPMRLLMLVAALAMVGCDWIPEELDHLANSIGEQADGEALAMRMGTVVVVSVSSPTLYALPADALLATATDFARQTVAATDAGVETVSISVYEDEMSEQPDPSHEFIFDVVGGVPRVVGSR